MGSRRSLLYRKFNKSQKGGAGNDLERAKFSGKHRANQDRQVREEYNYEDKKCAPKVFKSRSPVRITTAGGVPKSYAGSHYGSVADVRDFKTNKSNISACDL